MWLYIAALRSSVSAWPYLHLCTVNHPILGALGNVSECLVLGSLFFHKTRPCAVTYGVR